MPNDHTNHAAYTALVLAGLPHPLRNGLADGAQRLWLCEHPEPTWVMDPTDGASGKRMLMPRSPDTVLEDGLLFLAALAFRFDDVTSRFAGSFGPRIPDEIDLWATTAEDYRALIRASRDASREGVDKVVLAAFAGSALLKQLPALEHYQYAVDVLTPVYTLRHPHRRDQPVRAGTLNPEEITTP